MVAFPANSVLCRAALGGGEIDAASFSAIRLLSGALALAATHAVRRGARTPRRAGWFSAALLFLYAVGIKWDVTWGKHGLYIRKIL